MVWYLGVRAGFAIFSGMVRLGIRVGDVEGALRRGSGWCWAVVAEDGDEWRSQITDCVKQFCFKKCTLRHVRYKLLSLCSKLYLHFSIKNSTLRHPYPPSNPPTPHPQAPSPSPPPPPHKVHLLLSAPSNSSSPPPPSQTPS